MAGNVPGGMAPAGSQEEALGRRGFPGYNPDGSRVPGPYDGGGPTPAGGGKSSLADAARPYGAVPPTTGGPTPPIMEAGAPTSGAMPPPGWKPNAAGWGTSLADLNAQLGQHGVNASFGNGALNLSGGGRSYQNVGAQHEGAGPGGQAEFLRNAGVEGGSGPRGWGGDVARLDAEAAGVGQRGRYYQSLGLDPNATMEQFQSHMAQRQAAAPQVNYLDPSSWAGAQQRAAAARGAAPGGGQIRPAIAPAPVQAAAPQPPAAQEAPLTQRPPTRVPRLQRRRG